MNKAQATILELFQHRTMTPAELSGLKDVLVGYLAQQLDDEVATVLAKKGMTPADMTKQAAFANRTKRLEKIRREKP